MRLSDQVSHTFPSVANWVWVKIKLPGDRMFGSMFPCTRVPFWGCPIFDNHRQWLFANRGCLRPAPQVSGFGPFGTSFGGGGEGKGGGTREGGGGKKGRVGGEEGKGGGRRGPAAYLVAGSVPWGFFPGLSF